jgi:hypothetical protein
VVPDTSQSSAQPMMWPPTDAATDTNKDNADRQVRLSFLG